MTRDEFDALMGGDDDCPDDFLKFERVVGERRLSDRPDLCAFLLLDRLVPGKSDIVTSAEHDQFWLDVEIEAFLAVATPEDVITLLRCGVTFDAEVESFFCYT